MSEEKKNYKNPISILIHLESMRQSILNQIGFVFLIVIIVPMLSVWGDFFSITIVQLCQLICITVFILGIYAFLGQFFYYVSDKFNNLEEETRLRDKYLLAEIDIIRNKLDILQDTMQRTEKNE